MLLRLPDALEDRVVSARLAQRGVYVPALSDYARGGTGAPYPGLVIGYASTSADRLRAAVAEISGALSSIA